MSQKRRKPTVASIIDQADEALPSEVMVETSRSRITKWIKAHRVVSGLIVLGIFAVSALAVNYLVEDARDSSKLPARKRSALSQINPFFTGTPTPTPQLSKEYIYAGSRLLAVADADAFEAPPADLAVWRPSNGIWFVMGGEHSAAANYYWGISGDIPVPGDYDGDGKTDFAVFRNGTWYVVQSSNGYEYSFNWGVGTDLTAPGDFDGDGKTDIAVFRPSEGKWYVWQSSNSTEVDTYYGVSGDKPTPADFDGDGKADFALWRNGEHTIYVKFSSTGNSGGMVIGSTGDTPVVGDYDGDGKANYAVKSGSNWIIANAAANATTTTVWGSPTGTPVQNDYDGDGKVDIATWEWLRVGRVFKGTWDIQQSHDNSHRTDYFGINGDIPVPALYRR